MPETKRRIIHLGKKPYAYPLGRDKDLVLFLLIEFANDETSVFTYWSEVPSGDELRLNDELPDGARLVAYYEPRSKDLKDPDTSSDLDFRRYEKSRHRELYQQLRRLGDERTDEKETARREILTNYARSNVPRRLAL